MRKLLFRFYLFCKNKIKGASLHPRKLLQELNDSQYWTRPSIQEYQLSKLNDLLNESFSNVPYYQSIEDKISLPLKDLHYFNQHFPKITKDKIVGASKNLENSLVNSFAIHATSGSTGTPLQVKVSNQAESYRIANRMRFYKWWGLNLYDKHVLIWRPSEKETSFLKNSIKSLRNFLLGRLNIDVFDLHADTVHGHVKTIEKFRPKYLRGYKSGVLEFARLIYDNNIKIKDSTIQLIIVTSEVLLVEERHFIQDVFGAKVANEYGAADGGQFAFECPEGSLHVNEESVIMTTDSMNNLCITELFNYKMPLINYENQDRVIFSEGDCPCGRTLKIIDHIVGRTADYIDCKDGNKKHSLIFIGIFNDIQNRFPKSIRQFRVVQDMNSLIFEIVQDINYEPSIEDFLRENVYTKVCSDLDVYFEYVTSIERESNGKLRYFVKKDHETQLEKR